MEPINENATPTIRPLAASLQEIAIAELNEKPERIEEDIRMLRKWICKQPHLKARTNDQFLLGFLRGSKFSLEKAKQKIDRYYTLKAAIPEVFNEQRVVDDSKVMEIIRLGVILQLPMPTDYTGPCITIIRACSYDTAKYKFADVIRVGSMFGEIMIIEDDNSCVSGYVEVMDMTNVNGTHLFQLKPDLLRKFSMFADEAMPMRQKGTHFINVPAPFEKGFQTLRSFFPAKAVKRITVNSDPAALYEHIPQELLPVEYGGVNGTIDEIVERMVARIERYRDYFAEECNYGTDERLRENGLDTCRSIFGTEGSFRKLEID